MVYAIVLNWNCALDTIHCIQSLIDLNDDKLKIIVCDNASSDLSIELLDKFMSKQQKYNYLNIHETQIRDFVNVDYNLILIKNNNNYGYAGGNNKGIKFSLNQIDTDYLWILNNDTEVHKDALNYLIEKINSDESYGVVGSKLVDFDDRDSIQGFAGIINKKICTTKEIGGNYKINDYIDENLYENRIDYIIGASMFFKRSCLEKVGYLCEDYFLYYEEIDICNRIKRRNMKVGIASKSVVYHKHGVSTDKGKSEIADKCIIKNRLIICKKFYKESYYLVKLSMLLVAINRLRRLQIGRAIFSLKLAFFY